MNTQRHYPTEVHRLCELDPGREDDAILLAASWEERCLALARAFDGYSCKAAFVTVYDGKSPKREAHIEELRANLRSCEKLVEIPALHRDPINNVRETIAQLRKLGSQKALQISIDITTYTRRHLLQLLQGLEVANLLTDVRFFYSEQRDYHTCDNEPTSKGIAAIETIRTFGGSNRPSKDSLLVLFLGFEGTRAQAILERLEPNAAVAVLGQPMRPDWKGRAEAQNRYVLSTLQKDNIFDCSLIDPTETVGLLNRLFANPRFSPDKYDYLIAPVGSKPQVLGIYWFWREHPFEVSLEYAAPVKYREEQDDFGPGRIWFIDRSSTWPISQTETVEAS